MSVTDTLQDWKKIATTTVELHTLKKQVTDLQSALDGARVEFEKDLEALPEAERETILSIMSIYEKGGPTQPAATHPPETSGSRNVTLKWLLNKVGNEGVNGIQWATVLEAWATQYPDTATSILYTTVNQNAEFFAKSGEGKKAILTLTPEGQTQFLNSD